MSERDQASYHRARQRTLRQKKRCVWCAARTRAGHSLCVACRAKQRELYAERRAEGLCTVCGEPAAGAYACQDCRDRHNARRRDRRQ